MLPVFSDAQLEAKLQPELLSNVQNVVVLHVLQRLQLLHLSRQESINNTVASQQSDEPTTTLHGASECLNMEMWNVRETGDGKTKET